MNYDRDQLQFEWHASSTLNNQILQECADLFSNHYGIWSATGARPGQRIRLPLEKLRSNWVSDNSWAATCRHRGQLIGYAFAVRSNLKGRGWISWVTQLVVHSDFRNRKIATELLQSIWAFSDDFAWGLVTANPYTVRALEKATRRRCDPAVIGIYRPLLCEIGNQQIPFVRNKTVSVDSSKAIIDTEFHVDHSEVGAMLASVSESQPWTLGELGDGEEWFAFTFRKQQAFELTPEEFDMLMNDSERSVRQAYERMSLDSNHLWTSHSETESYFIKEALGIPAGSKVLDFGCGMGRHSRELARFDLQITGIDFVDKFITKAKSITASEKISGVNFEQGDCRIIQLGQKFNFGICLYDVIGSFRDDESNMAILRNFSEHIQKGGRVLISVMNLGATAKRVIHSGVLPKDLNKIEALKPSQTMQFTGNIFDPEYFFLDLPTKVVYRKEQFSEDLKLPAQIIVADRRYGREELVQLCKTAGIREISCRCVRAGDWKTDLEEHDSRAKEILFLGEKIE